MDNSTKTTIVSLTSPTPKWVKFVVRGISWITATFALLMTLGVDFSDFGMGEHTQFILLKYMAIATGATSVVARFIGIKPVKFDTDNPLPPNS